MTAPQRIAQLGGSGHDETAVAVVHELLAMAQQILPRMYLADRQLFAHTVRRETVDSRSVRLEGVNVRYTAIVALGVAHLALEEQRAILAGHTAAELAETVAEMGTTAPDLGTAALAGWACAEITGRVPTSAFDRITREINYAAPQPTVDYAWALTALLATGPTHQLAPTAERAAERLMAAQGAEAIFPHALPAITLRRFRAHVGCYADQVYPIQALARYFAATADRRALDAANRCAARIVELQGGAGQWWWHYDLRNGHVVEGYPVYSVHQHAMGPMALFDLHAMGGSDHREAIRSGLSWLQTHPETQSTLLDAATGAVWRKIGRREPRKAVRSLRAASTSMFRDLRMGWLDRVFPAGVVDYECRPYELGWLLYAWLTRDPTVPDSAGGAQRDRGSNS